VIRVVSLRVGLLVSAALVGCGGSSSEGLRTADVITSCAAVGAPLSEQETMAYMAGRYRLVMVRDNGRDQVIGILDLERTPEAYRDWGPSIATLSGAANINLSTVGAQEMRGIDATDPAAPGVLVLESEGSAGPSIVLRFGSDANQQGETAFDGAYTALDIQVVEGDRFAGDWQSGVMAERVEGYFCAQRIQP